MSETVFTRNDNALGRFEIRPADPVADIALLHDWLTHEKSVFWGMSEADADTVEQYLREAFMSQHRDIFVGSHQNSPVFFLERYDPASDLLATVLPVSEGDVGMHFLVAPAREPVHGMTRAVLITVMEFLFSEAGARRVVVEPDVRNQAVHLLNARVGFQELATVPLGDKQALLSTCTRNQFAATRRTHVQERQN